MGARDVFYDAHYWATRDHMAPFGDAWPTIKAPKPVEADTFDRDAEIRADDAGHRPNAEDGAVDTLVAKLKVHPHKQFVNAWVAEARDAGYGFNPRTKPTLRRYEILRAAYWCAFNESVSGNWTSELLECFDVTGDTVGARLGQLVTDEAVRLADMAQNGLDPDHAAHNAA